MRDNEIANILKQAIRKHDAGDFQFAENAYIKILEANPDHPEANFRMSMLAIRAMVWEDAAVFAAKAAKGAPGVISYRMTLANVLHKLRRYEEAERIMHSVYGLMRHTPEAARIAFNLVDLLVDMGRRAEAHAVCEDALQRQPNNEHLLYAKGKMLEAEGKMDEARAAYEAVLKRNKAHDQSLVRLGRIMDMKGQYSAYLDLVAPVASKSRSAALHAMAAAVYVHAGRNYEAVDSYRRALINSHVPNPMMHTAMLCSMVASDRIGDKELHDQSVFWDMLYKNGLQKLSFEGDRDPEKPLRVGVISAAFRRHTTSRILLPLLPELAKHFELFGYHDGFIEDDYTQRYKEMFKGWKSTVRLGYEDAAKAIREDKIDVLLDISGFLEGSRPPVLMFEPAPVQIHYCGGPMSLGLSCIRYRISDEVAEPAALCDANSSEKILRLEDGIFVYQPDVEVDDPGPIPQKKNGHITFGSCNALYKVSDTTLATWRAALEAVPGSRLDIVRDVFDIDPGSRSHWTRRLVAAGIPEERFTLRSVPFAEVQRLTAYNSFDIALDCYPYAGATTTMDALWMGVPVITLCGGRFSSRIATSILARAGLGDLAAKDPADFGRIAAALAADRDRRVFLRKDLRKRMASSPMGDPAALASALAEAVRDAWRDTMAPAEAPAKG
jgi:predicted O-linked N-acetylglucosamine transferase (SPINDLY family)